MAWTSSATHAVLPLLATDAGVRLQVQSGLRTHRARVGERWRGGFWLPECAYAPGCDETLADAGVHATCVELTDRLGLGVDGHLSPIATASGLTLVPVDRATIDLVWGARGYPSRPPYRDSHRRTTHWYHPWANSGEPYDHAAALAAARDDARDFVARVRRPAARGADAAAGRRTARVRARHRAARPLVVRGRRLAARRSCRRPSAGGGARAPRRRAGPPSGHGRRADGALDGVCSWGTDRALGTWDGPAVADMAWAARRAELAAVAAGRADRRRRRAAAAGAAVAATGPSSCRANWRPRTGASASNGHLQGLAASLRGRAAADEPLRELARHADVSALLEP